MDSLMPTLNDLYKQGRMTWTEQGKGWIGRPEEMLGALATDGFYECHRERAASPSGRRPTEGAWDGVKPAHEIRGLRHLDGPAGAGAADGVHRN
ncbi:MAG: hypothetical protein Q7W02_09630 [Candidatus Rokubacteria bacterium]|nr:hypothetical protein [Candidatus Rokubacteria bacterium]